MNNDNGTLNFGTAIDLSGFDEGMNQIAQKAAELGSNVEVESARISELLTKVPTVNLDFVSNAAQTLGTIDSAFAEIDLVVDENKAAIRELEAEYEKLSQIDISGNSGEVDVNAINEQKQAIQENIALRQQVIEESGKIADALAQTEQRIISESEAVATSSTSIREQLGQIGAACEQHEAVLDRLENEYKQLTAKMSKAFMSGDDKEYHALKQKQEALKKEISERKKALTELRNQSNALEEEATKLEKNTQATEKNAQKHVSLRTQIRQVREELVQMEASGQRGTAAYRALQEEAGRLTDMMADATTQANIMAHDQRGFQGVISGLTGMSGAFSAVTGTMSLFAGENEELQKIQTKLQSVMAITMGLQQVQQTLNKDSAFTLVTLNGLKEWWNKLLVIGAGAQAEEAAATTADTAAEVANTGATAANTAAKQANAGATGAATAATGANTAGQVANTGAAAAGTAANIGLAGAFRMVGAAIKSIPIFGWIAAAIGAIIGVVSHFVSKAKEAKEAIKEQNKYLEEGNKAYADAASKISHYQARLDTFNGTKEQEKELVKKLNDEFGTEMGYCKSIAEWKKKLADKSEDYCKAMMAEANASALAAEAAKLYTEALALQDSVKYKTYDTSWFATDEQDERRILGEADTLMKRRQALLDKMEEQTKEAARIRAKADLGGHIDPNSSTKKSGKGSGNTFDPKKAALEQKKAIEAYRDAVKKYINNSEQEITQAIVDAQEEGMIKELNTLALNTARQKQEWQDRLRELAEVKKQAEHDYYMSKKGATEVGWAESARGKMSIEEYKQELLQNEQINEQYQARLTQIEEQAAAARLAIQQKYTDALVSEFGTIEQKSELLTRQWFKRLNEVQRIAPEMMQQAIDAMEKDFENLEISNFKINMNWDGVFGNLGEQSIQALQYNLDKVKDYFEKAKKSMSVQEIKEFQEAISKMETEIASRNPFTAFHKSLKDISAAKDEFINAMNDWKTAQEEQTAAKNAYNEALEAQKTLQEQVNNGELTEDSEAYKNAENALAKAKTDLANATVKANNAEQRTLNARNNLTSAYKTFANNLKGVGGVIKDVGGKAKNLAEALGSDISAGLGKALDFIDEVIGATSDVISAIGDVGKNVAKGVESTVDAAAQGTTAAAAAGATAISTIEKASVILAVISAALQIATAIANLFNNDDEKQEEIEKLQRRIDQLQWELDNSEAVRIRDRHGDAVARLKEIYADVTKEVLRLHGVADDMMRGFRGHIYQLVYSSEIYRKSIQKIADEYAKLSYTADKTLGAEKYKEGRKQIENLAEQQILLQKQINEENSKKKTDHGKIEEWQRQIQENAAEMAKIINEMLEDIIGFTVEDLASELGNAFFDAFKEGEDAAEAWGKKVNDIVGDILKRMMIQKLLEEPLGEIFNRYKKKWFGDDGRFRGFNAVEGSLTDFANELNSMVGSFSSAMNELPDELREMLMGEAERQGVSKGIATASQDSVDENNARLTTIQGHTYTLVQGQEELNRTTNAILERVTGIERNTSEANNKLDAMSKNIRQIKDTTDDIQTRGIKIKA